MDPIINLDETGAALSGFIDGSQANLLHESLLLQRQEAEASADFEAYVSVETKLQQLEEFEIQRLERQARRIEAQVRIQTAQRQLSQGSSG